MEITESGERRQEHWKLLSSLKTTVEGLLSTNNPNVWAHYGGLQRLHKDMNNILSHGLRNDVVCCKKRDYWRFVWCVRFICPHLAWHVEQFSHLAPVQGSVLQDAGEGHKAERWLLHSLQHHCLSAQLQPLLNHQAHTRKFYYDDAFVLSEPYVSAMLRCLEAVEQKSPQLLALMDTDRLWHLNESPLGLQANQTLRLLTGMGLRRKELQWSLPQHLATSQGSLPKHDPGPLASGTSSETLWSCRVSEGESSDAASSPGVPQIMVAEPSSSVEGGEPGAQDAEDGPEYLAIGDLGHRRHADTGSSMSASEQDDPPGMTWALPDVCSRRRSSFSEGQGEQGRGCKMHSRSLSDTGLAQRHRQESSEDSQKPGKSQEKGCSNRSTSNSVCLESECSQYSSMSDSMFRKPSEGQSLISYLSEQDFGSCADLEKENAHFNISESLIAAIELMKCNVRCQEEEDEEDSDCEIRQLKHKILLRRQQIRRGRLQASPDTQHAIPSTDSGGSGRSSQDSLGLSDFGSVEDMEECDLTDADVEHSMTRTSNKSSQSSKSTSYTFYQSSSAESVAMGLLRQFEGMQLPAASDLDWLVPEHEAPQKLLPIPDSFPVSPDDGEHADIYKLRIRVRGNLEWAPPRPQIIFNIHPSQKRKVVVCRQNYRCAGCGTRADPGYIKRLRYCEYVGRYFCQCCHEDAQVVVPARVLRKWDFGKYPVSNFARDLLGKIAGDPLFNPKDINYGLYKKVKAMEAVRLLRVQLYHMKNLFKTCRFANGLLDVFDSLPGHLTEDLHLFSLNDLNAVRRGDLVPKLRELFRLGSLHISTCVLCQAKGFVCEFCGNGRDIIFPFQLNKCQRCEGELPLLAVLSSANTPATRSQRLWKFRRLRRMARALSQDRKEGEGGEEEPAVEKESEAELSVTFVSGEAESKVEKGENLHGNVSRIGKRDEREKGRGTMEGEEVQQCSENGEFKDTMGGAQHRKKKVPLFNILKAGKLSKASPKDRDMNTDGKEELKCVQGRHRKIRVHQSEGRGKSTDRPQGKE